MKVADWMLSLGSGREGFLGQLGNCPVAAFEQQSEMVAAALDQIDRLLVAQTVWTFSHHISNNNIFENFSNTFHKYGIQLDIFSKMFSNIF